MNVLFVNYCFVSPYFVMDLSVNGLFCVVSGNRGTRSEKLRIVGLAFNKSIYHGNVTFILEADGIQ